ncbi:MAG: hypothetical protein GEU81_18155, partial [Nitriliruptorales bacterium]|nr:hypothetical protein [Nitriliruptorales bacterium]
ARSGSGRDGQGRVRRSLPSIPLEEPRVLIRVQLTLPRDASYVPVTRDVANCVLERTGVPDEAAGDIKAAIGEACADAVRHASGSSEYVVSLELGPGGCEVEVVDVGPAFEVPESYEVDPEAESGRGLLLMRALVDDFEFIREQDANRVRLVKRWLAPVGSSASSDGSRPTA